MTRQRPQKPHDPMSAYYNEVDPFTAQWLRNLIAAGHIAHGVVDERSITEVAADDLRGFTQCHFFAGIGVWSHALRRAGWSDDVPVWTGSCPCQPFSAAGKQKGFEDERHLWPVWFELIRQCRPPVVLGEQVASALELVDVVSADLEDEEYAFAAADLCAAGFSGAHIRQRLYFFARDEGVGYPGTTRLEGHTGNGAGVFEGSPEGRSATASGAVDWVYCRDGSWRPVEPGTFPLAHEIAGRVGRLRAYGNGLDAETASQFCAAVMECMP